MSPDVEAFRDEIVARIAGRASASRTCRSTWSGRRSARTRSRLRRRGGALPAASRRVRPGRPDPAIGTGCDNGGRLHCDRYLWQGVRNSTRGYTPVIDALRASPGNSVTGPAGAPRGVVRETAQTRGGVRPPDNGGTSRPMTTEPHRCHDQCLAGRAAAVRPRRRAAGPRPGHAPRPARAAPRADRPLPGDTWTTAASRSSPAIASSTTSAAARPRAASATTRTSPSTRSRPSRCG